VSSGTTLNLPQGSLDKPLDLTAASFFLLRVIFGLLRQFKDLKEGSVKGDQIFPNKAISGSDVFIEAKPEQRAYGVIGIIGQTVAIRDKTKEEVKKHFFLAETGEKTITYEAVRNKAETTLYTSQSIGVKNFFGDHDHTSFLKGFTA
jgi:hypothetical protein